MCGAAQTWDDVFSQDSYIRVPVRAHLFVMEAESMENLMLHHVKVQTAIGPQGHVLSASLTAHEGPAADTQTHNQFMNFPVETGLIFLLFL